MAKSFKSLALRIALALFGQTIRDHRTGRPLGRALLIPIRGRIRVIGLRAAVVPEFLPSRGLVYWQQVIGFTTHPRPDHNDIRDADRSADASR